MQRANNTTPETTHLPFFKGAASGGICTYTVFLVLWAIVSYIYNIIYMHIIINFVDVITNLYTVGVLMNCNSQ